MEPSVAIAKANKLGLHLLGTSLGVVSMIGGGILRMFGVSVVR